MKKSKVSTPRIAIEPPVYYCPRAKAREALDGRIDKDFWADVPFSDTFVDISGKDFPTPRYRTRMKMCWDDENLYIAALLEGDEIWATLTERDCVIYLDNDFEVFVDPSSSTHNYMELELNAINTQWDLMLTHPYRDGGRSVTGWDMKGLETAVHVDGLVNDPRAGSRSWSVEIRIPFAGLMETYSCEENPPELARCYPARKAPRLGEVWRMNFSRVQWTVDVVDGRYQKRTDANGDDLPEDNWVWAPTGLIDIHCPEFWGYVFFTEKGEPMPIPANELRKTELREVFYAEHRHFQAKGCFTEDITALDAKLVPEGLEIEATRGMFLAACPGEGGSRVCVREDGYTWVE